MGTGWGHYGQLSGHPIDPCNHLHGVSVMHLQFYGFTPPLPLLWAAPFTRTSESNRRRQAMLPSSYLTSKFLWERT